MGIAMGTVFFFLFVAMIGYAVHLHYAAARPVQFTPTIEPRFVRDRWVISENGNWTISADGKRVTVFEGYNGWTVCVAYGDDDDEPEYTDSFDSQKDAMAYAVGELPDRLRHLAPPVW